MTEITIPAGVCQIRFNAFDNDGALKTVYYGGTGRQWQWIQKDEDGNADLLRAEIVFSQTEVYAPGDADGDGELTPGDARLALRASVGLKEKGDVKKGSAGYLACDADGDGKVTSDDARLILRASVGLEKLS